MIGGVSHEFNIRIRELNDKEEDASKGKEEDGRDSEDQHAKYEAVQLPETYRPKNDKRLQGTVPKIILSRSPLKA